MVSSRLVAPLLALLLGFTAGESLGVAAPAAAHPLVPLAADRLVELPPLLRHGDIALIESFPNGRLKQVSLLLLVAAPASLVRDVVADVAKYPEFIRNMTKSTVRRNPDGTVDNQWVVDFTVTSFDNTNRNYFRSDGSIDVDTVPNHDARYRWEFVPAGGGATVLAMYGYVEVPRGNDLLQSIVRRAPTMEHGLALSAMLVQARSVKLRAERLAGGHPVALDPKAHAPGFNFLLERGKVAVIRSTPSGHLADVSLLDRIYAPVDKVIATLVQPGRYHEFIEGVKQSEELARDDKGIKYRIEVAIPLCSWDTRYLMKWDGGGGVDSFGVDGDLKGSRMRWDVTATGPRQTLAVLRENQDLAATSLVLRALFQKEPLFEHGITVALGLVTLAGVRRRAESMATGGTDK